MSNPKQLASARRGFTLTEMLVVVGIIILIVTLAVPAMNAITGNRSIDAAQNQLAAIIGRARQEAIGLQQPCGIIMFQDQNTGRACAAEVNFPDTTNPTLLGVAPNHDELLLPPGVSFRMVETVPASSIATTGSGYCYSSMNVIMFNSRGEFIAMPWAVLWMGSGSNPSPPPNPASIALGTRILQGGGNLLPALAQNMVQPIQVSETPSSGAKLTVLVDPNPLPAAATPTSGSSAFGFILFPDEAAYQNAFTQDPQTTYLTDNGITFLINKYNGTLLRSE